MAGTGVSPLPVFVYASDIFDSVMVHITAMYPTILIILIELGQIQHQVQFTSHAAVQAHGSEPQRVTIAVDVDVERSVGTVLDIGRDSTESDHSDAAFMQYSKAQ